MASVSDNFDRENGEIGADWTEDSGDIDIVSNRANNITDSGMNLARYTATALDSSNHFVQVDTDGFGDNPDGGVSARQASSTATYYQGIYQNEDDVAGYVLRRVVAGAETALDDAASGNGEKEIKLTVDGATQSMEIDTVEVCTDTDSDIDTGLYAGIAGYKARCSYDNWSAEDLAGSSSSSSESTSVSSSSGSESTSISSSSSSESTSISSSSSSESTSVSSSSSSESTSVSSSSSSESTSISSSSSSESTSVSSSSSSESLSAEGWTWGEQNPDPETAVEWSTWKIKETENDARDSGDWGELQLGSGEEFVSDVKDLGSVLTRYLTLTYDDYAVGSGSGTLYWRGQAAGFDPEDNEVAGPTWEVYSPANKDWRYIQVMCAG